MFNCMMVGSPWGGGLFIATILKVLCSTLCTGITEEREEKRECERDTHTHRRTDGQKEKMSQ